MNLDLVPLGWVHFVASLAALAIAAVVIFRPKGTAVHKRRGRIYVVALAVTAVTALGIYRLGIFFFPHWFAVAALMVVAVGFGTAHFKRPRTGWVQLHLTCMLVSVYILVGGGVNEVFLGVGALHRLAATAGPAIIGWTHLAVIVLFAFLIAWFNSANLLHRRDLPGGARSADEPIPATAAAQGNG